MHIAIIGTGSMASLFAARLSKVARVSMLGSWAAQLAALQTGLRLIHPNGQEDVLHPFATNQVADIQDVDVVLVLVKSYQTERAARQIQAMLPQTNPLFSVLSLQNGIGNLEKFTAITGHPACFLGITTQAAKLVDVGVVKDTGKGKIYLAHSEQFNEQLKGIAELLKSANFDTAFSDEQGSLVWGKLAINAGINPLTALLGVKNGFLAENELARKWMFQLAKETEAVAEAMGIQLPFPDIQAQILQVAKATASNHSSMYQDVQRGGLTEIEAINQEVIRYAKRHKVAVPMNEKVYELVKRLERKEMTSCNMEDLRNLLEI